MKSLQLSRRQFMETTAAALAFHPINVEAQVPAGTSSAPLPPEVLAGSLRPLRKGSTARPMRYQPREGGFVIVNGSELFNRPLYGPEGGFRIDASDLPECSLYLPGHAGNLRLGISAGGRATWLAEAGHVEANYLAGGMVYTVRDAVLGAGELRIELLTAGSGSGLLLRAEAKNIPSDLALSWAFGGASGRKGRRGGDIGCENEPVSRLFQLRPEECERNRFTLAGTTARLESPFCALDFVFPAQAQLAVDDVAAWSRPVVARASAASLASERPILTGWVPLSAGRPVFLSIQRGTAGAPATVVEPAQAFPARRAQLTALAGAVRSTSSDAAIDAAFAALNIAANAVWDEPQECVMHGAVAWRMALAGWRGPYCLDALGSHARMQRQVRHWIAKQNLDPVTTADPATGPFDARTHRTRKEALLHSNGNLTRNHYDMNLVFFDAFFRHLRWTGDLALAREVWPALERHLAWEHRLFRRVYTTKEGRELPLYEAYAAIWASDNLQYNGGGTAHASAYNLFALRSAAQLARLLGKDATAYEREAALLAEGIEKLLWLPDRGVLAESKDLLGPQTVYDNPALWTLYHAIDSEAVTAAQSWQMIAERLHALPAVPVSGEGVPAGDWYMLSCSDWLPYMWSLNLLVLAEGVHMALALWQAGRVDEAFALLKGNLLDSMFQGITPGNFHMSSQLDAHRQEAQRDFADPIGITARALVEGLFGVAPDLLNNRLRLQPGFPSDWTTASLTHPDFDYAWKREGQTETLSFTSRLAKPVALELRLRVRGVIKPQARCNGAVCATRFEKDAVGTPWLVVSLPAARAWQLQILWRGAAPVAVPAVQSLRRKEALALPHGIAIENIEDPQQALRSGKVAAEGFHTVFAQVRQGDCSWRLPLSFVVAEEPAKSVNLAGFHAAQMEPLNLDAELRDDLRTILTRDHSEPRSPYCSLAFPEQLIGGWSTMSLDFPIDDSGLRRAGGLLHTVVGVPFRTPAGTAPNSRFLSYWKGDAQSFSVSLKGRAEALAVLVTGTTLPQTSHIRHGSVTVRYADGGEAVLPLTNPETWWPIEQDFLLDDYLFVDEAALPARVDLASGATRMLDAQSFKGKGREVPGGAATLLTLALDPARELASLRFACELYGMVVAVLGATLIRPR